MGKGESVSERKIDIMHDNVQFPVHQIPKYKLLHARDHGNLKRVLLHTFAGIGDQVCAEPTLRYAIKCRDNGKIEKVALASSMSELFAHLKFDEVFSRGQQYDLKEWYQFQTVPMDIGLQMEFISHGLTNCVDASSLYAFRMQLPTKDRELVISSRNPGGSIEKLFDEPTIVVHAGRHWSTKTFPKWWWDAVLSEIISAGIKPILIGANVDGNRKTVEVETRGCVDLRDKTMLAELAWVCQRATVVLTNDSSPLHFAASTDPLDYGNTGNAWIGYLATCKHADYITHFRKNIWQWREVDFSKGGVWDIFDFIPNKVEDTRIDLVDDVTLESWLPPPKEYAEWAISKIK